MKLDQVFVHQLYNNKKITLQGIGIFTLNNSFSVPVDSEKGMVLPEDAISFLYDPKATEDEALIDAIVQYTKKIKPLASADLDSYLMLGRQFLNIGKPFIIEGLGTLDKAQTGELVFIPGQFITPRIEAPKALKENENEEKSGLFPDYDREVNTNGNRTLWIIFAVILLSAGAWAAYHFIFKKNNTEEANETTQTVKTDTIQKKDTTQKPPAIIISTDTTSALKQQTNNDGYTFKIVFKQTHNEQKAINTLHKYKKYGHKVIMYTTDDSITFKVAESFTLPLSDTTHIKDSLNKYYYLGKAHVELK